MLVVIASSICSPVSRRRCAARGAPSWWRAGAGGRCRTSRRAAACRAGPHRAGASRACVVKPVHTCRASGAARAVSPQRAGSQNRARAKRSVRELTSASRHRCSSRKNENTRFPSARPLARLCARRNGRDSRIRSRASRRSKL
jgi:hypothetical protein